MGDKKSQNERQPGKADKPGEMEKNMKKTMNTTATRNASVVFKHNPGTYYGRQNLPVYAPYKPGTITAPEIIGHTMESPVNAPEKPVNKPENVKPENITKAPEKPAKAPKTSPAALMNSKPNTETNKPGKREKARQDAAAFIPVLHELTAGENRDLIDYSDRVAGLYRLQARIDGKMKAIARVKLQRDVYILVRENVAKELQFDYDLINYNLPAGTHFEYTAARDAIERLYALFEE